MNYGLVYSLGSTATTIALLVAEAVGAIIQMYYARQYFKFGTFIQLFFKYLLLSILVYVSVVIIGNYVSLEPIILTVLQVVVVCIDLRYIIVTNKGFHGC